MLLRSIRCVHLVLGTSFQDVGPREKSRKESAGDTPRCAAYVHGSRFSDLSSGRPLSETEMAPSRAARARPVTLVMAEPSPGQR